MTFFDKTINTVRYHDFEYPLLCFFSFSFPFSFTACVHLSTDTYWIHCPICFLPLASWILYSTSQITKGVLGTSALHLLTIVIEMFTFLIFLLSKPVPCTSLSNPWWSFSLSKMCSWYLMDETQLLEPQMFSSCYMPGLIWHHWQVHITRYCCMTTLLLKFVCRWLKFHQNRKCKGDIGFHDYIHLHLHYKSYLFQNKTALSYRRSSFYQHHCIVFLQIS